jgi:hypothetical protein
MLLLREILLRFRISFLDFIAEGSTSETAAMAAGERFLGTVGVSKSISPLQRTMHLLVGDAVAG